MPPMYWFDHEWPTFERDRPFGPVTSVAEDADGTLYVLGRPPSLEPLIAIGPDGKYLRTVRTWDDGLFRYPHGLRIDAERMLWATDIETNQVHRLDPDGRLLASFGVRGEAGGGPDHLDAPTDVAFGADDDVLIGDGHRASARIVRISRTGRWLGEWGRPGDQPGELHLPHSLIVGDDGLVYVCDRHNFRIQVFDRLGRSESIWPYAFEPHWIDRGADGTAWIVTSVTAKDLATPGEPPIRNLSYSASLSRCLRVDLTSGAIEGGLEAPPATGGHAVTATRNGGLVVSSLTRGILTWQPGMHPAFEGEWGDVRERTDVVVNYIPGAGTTTGTSGA